MINDRLFNKANKLQDYHVFIDDVDLIKETIISVEVSYKNNTPIVYSKVIFNDIYDMNLLRTWRNIEVQISYIDIFDESINKKFVILNVTEQYDDSFKKVLVLELQDKFSYVLENSYISKSFNDNPTSAFLAYAKELEIDAISDLTLETTNVESTYNFVVPNNESNLSFFIKELYKHGYTFYQNKTSICVKSLSDLAPEILPVNGLYLNETNNQLYQNKIISLISSLNNRSNILPKTRSVSFNSNTKSLEFGEDNDMTQYFLNSDPFDLQDSNGVRDVTQPHLDFNQHNLMMKESFLDQAEVEMIVNGYVKNDINQVYELQLKGNLATANTQASGNLVMNGYYVCNKITDKIVGDSLLQKVSLHRSDLTSRV